MKATICNSPKLILTAIISTLALFSYSQNQRPFVVRASDSRFGVPTPFKVVNVNDLKISSRDTHGDLSVFYYIGIQKTGPSFHKHLSQNEVFYILDGEYLFRLGDEKTVLHRGDMIFLPMNIPHTWLQLSDTGRMFYFVQPAIRMEEFFVRLSELEGKGSPADYEKLGRESEIVSLGPGMRMDEPHILFDTLSNGFVVRSGASRNEKAGRTTETGAYYLKVLADDTSTKLVFSEYIGNGKGLPVLNANPTHDEIYFISAGSYQFRCGDELFSLEKDDIIFLPRGLTHSWTQLTNEGRMLFLMQPAM